MRIMMSPEAVLKDEVRTDNRKKVDIWQSLAYTELWS